MELEGKIIAVTGAATGIGKAVAIQAAQKEAKVALLDINEQEINSLEEQLKLQSFEVLALPTDVSKPNSVEIAIKKIIDKWGSIDGICNSAGIQTYGSITETSQELWDKTISTNLNSIYLMCHFGLKHMCKKKSGSIVNVSSVQALATQPKVAAYAASKAAILALTKSMAVDYGALGIRINAVLPGSIDTPMLRHSAELTGNAEKALADWGNLHALKRIGNPEEVANLCTFLLSDQASFITGSQMVIDGGLTSQL